MDILPKIRDERKLTEVKVKTMKLFSVFLRNMHENTSVDVTSVN